MVLRRNAVRDDLGLAQQNVAFNVSNHGKFLAFGKSVAASRYHLISTLRRAVSPSLTRVKQP